MSSMTTAASATVVGSIATMPIRILEKAHSACSTNILPRPSQSGLYAPQLRVATSRIDKPLQWLTLRTHAVALGANDMGQQVNLNSSGLQWIGAYLTKPAGPPRGRIVV